MPSSHSLWYILDARNDGQDSTNDGIRRETGPRLLFSQLKVPTLSCFSPSLCVRHSLRCLHDSTRPHQLCWTFHRLVDSFKLATTCAAVYNVTFNREGGGVCRDENPPRCAHQHTSSYPAVKYRSEDKHLDGKHIWRREKEERGRLRLLVPRARATFWNHQLPGTRKGMASPISLCIWINRQSQSGAGYGASREKEPKLSKKSPEREAKGNGNKRKKKKRKKKCRWIRSDLPIHFPRKPLKSCTDAEKGRRRHFGCVCVWYLRRAGGGGGGMMERPLKKKKRRRREYWASSEDLSTLDATNQQPREKGGNIYLFLRLSAAHSSTPVQH